MREIEFGSPEHLAGLSRAALEDDFRYVNDRRLELEDECERLDDENAKLREVCWCLFEWERVGGTSRDWRELQDCARELGVDA